VIVVLPDVFPLEDDLPPVALDDPPADVEAPVVVLPMLDEPPVEVDAPVETLPTDPPAEVEAPVVVLPMLETEFAMGVLATAPPVVPPVVSTVT